MRVGIAGTGRMGTAIGARLIECGHTLAVWNRTAEKTRALAARGAAVASTPAALARGSEVVLSLLTDAAAVKQVYQGPEGLLADEVSGKLFVEMSTVGSATPRALGEAAAAKGADLVECPVSGSIVPAREGRLLGFAGGDERAVARARPLLEQLCRRLEHVGGLGAGAAMKLAINLPLMVYWQALAEALSLVRPLQLEPERVMSLFAESSGGPNVLKTRGPLIAAALRGEPAAEVSFDVDLMCKDVRTMIEEARALGRELPVAARVLEVYQRAAREGWGSEDCTQFIARWVARG